MIKILIDLRKTDLDKKSSNYEKDKDGNEYIESIMKKYDYYSLFDQIIKINTGSHEERKVKLISQLQNIKSQFIENETILIHFLGHGIVDSSSPIYKGLGIECIYYSELAQELNKIKEEHTLLINLMYTCFSNGLAPHECYNTLWCTNNETIDPYSSFNLYSYIDNNENIDSRTFLQVQQKKYNTLNLLLYEK